MPIFNELVIKYDPVKKKQEEKKSQYQKTAIHHTVFDQLQ